MFGMPLSAPAGATLSGRRSASRKELSSIVQLNKTAFSLAGFTKKIKHQKTDEFLAILRDNFDAHAPARRL